MSFSIILDLIVVAIFVLCVGGGMRKGLVKSVYRIFAFVLSIILSILLLQPFTQLLSQTPIVNSVRSSITHSIQSAGGDAVSDVDDMLSELHLPLFLRDDINNQYRLRENDTERNDVLEAPEGGGQSEQTAGLAAWTADALTDKIVGMLGAIILFVCIRILLGLLFKLLDAVFNLPLLKSVNKILGALLGLLNGAIIVYGLCAVLTLLSANAVMAPVMQAIEGSLVTRCFYEYNILLNLLTIGHNPINRI